MRVQIAATRIRKSEIDFILNTWGEQIEDGKLAEATFSLEVVSDEQR
jgi:hypothetical protein